MLRRKGHAERAVANGEKWVIGGTGARPESRLYRGCNEKTAFWQNPEKLSSKFRTLLSPESDTAYVTGLGYDGTSTPPSPASFDGLEIPPNSGAVENSVLLAAGELPSNVSPELQFCGGLRIYSLP